MRAEAIRAIEQALAARLGGLPRLVQVGSRQQYRTAAGQLIALRVRSHHPTRPPFFTVEQPLLTGTDWWVFVGGGHGTVVMPGPELRDLAPGLHGGGGSTPYKPTFVFEERGCSLYVGGERVGIDQWVDAFDTIAAREARYSMKRKSRS
jgi:hypothetical protein